MRWPVPCIRLSLTLPYLPPPLSKSSSSIPFISSFLGESVYRVNTTERITRDTIGFWPPLLFLFLLARDRVFVKVFTGIFGISRVNVEQGMLHDREIVSWIDRRKFDNDESVIKKIPFSFFLFRSLDALRNIICESFFPIPLFLILWFE